MPGAMSMFSSFKDIHGRVVIRASKLGTEAVVIKSIAIVCSVCKTMAQH